ncbi:MAG: TIGR01777 family oxidoreductase [Rickettsiaceae bacterium]|nr:TIGR01777 family oxidoreductase [Rickettsiaceae bacterium]
MKILIAGGTGLLGSHLCNSLLLKKYEIFVLTRNITKARQKLSSLVEIIDDLNNCDYKFDAVINLAGETLNQKWTSHSKKEFIDSRLRVTQKLVDFMNKSTHKPEIFISASAIGYYGHDYNASFSEESLQVSGEGFGHKLCKLWEQEALKIKSKKIRTCITRIGVVLSPDGGALQQMLTPFKFGLGAILGNGRQIISWIHIEDFAKAIEFLLHNKNSSGTYNLTSPGPVLQSQFASTLAKLMNRPLFLRLPSFLVEIIFGEMGKVFLLEGARVIPEKLLKEGYSFRYPALNSALSDIIK